MSKISADGVDPKDHLRSHDRKGEASKFLLDNFRAAEHGRAGSRQAFLRGKQRLRAAIKGLKRGWDKRRARLHLNPLKKKQIPPREGEGGAASASLISVINALPEEETRLSICWPEAEDTRGQQAAGCTRKDTRGNEDVPVPDAACRAASCAIFARSPARPRSLGHRVIL